MKAAIISAANAEYFPLVRGLIQSIHDCRPNQETAIGVLDIGLDSAQVEELKSMGALVAAGQWDVEFPGTERPPRWFQAMTARPHLPKYFPDFELIVWIDADAWLQDWRAIDMLKMAATARSFAIVPELHRAYQHVYRMAEFNHDGLYDMYRMSFPEEQAKFLAGSPIFNSGVFAARRDSELWQAWTRWMAVALRGQLNKMTEQSALNAAIYFDRIPFYPLPAWCNWTCSQALPAFDSASRRFVEPFLPFEVISVLHATPRRTTPRDIRTLDGKTVSLPLDYLAYKAASAV